VEHTFILGKQVNVLVLLSRSCEYHVFKNCCAGASNGYRQTGRTRAM